MQALLHVSQVPHMTGQFSLTSSPMTMSVHFPPYSERHWAGSILPLQVSVVVVTVVTVAVVVVAVVTVVVEEVHGSDPV